MRPSLPEFSVTRGARKKEETGGTSEQLASASELHRAGILPLGEVVLKQTGADLVEVKKAPEVFDFV
jgi:hypothetical protein